MTLNLPLLYVLWLEEYWQISPNKNKSPNLWHVTSILVCCIFATCWQYPLIDYLEIAYPLRIQGMLKMGNFHEDMFYSAYLTYLCLKVHSPWEEIYSHNHKRNLSGEGRRVLKKYEESVNFGDFSKMTLGSVV